MSTTGTNDTKEIDEVKDQVIELGRCYALWWYFLEKSNASRYARVERHYPDFFITTVDSLRTSFFVTAYRLFDKRTDVRSLVPLVNRLDVSDPALGAALRARIAAIEDIIEKKIKVLRHKVFAHRDRSQPPEDWFAEAGISPKEMETVVRTAQDIISTLVGAAATDGLTRELRSHEDAVRCDAHSLMQLLDQYTE